MAADNALRSSFVSALLAASALAACTAELRDRPHRGPAEVATDGAQSTDGSMAPGPPAGTPPDEVLEAEQGGRFGLAARMSKFEYQNSIQDVLGVALLPEELDARQGGLPDDTGDGVFKHLADNQTSVEQHALSYFQVAEAVAARTDLLALHQQMGICQAVGDACGQAFVQTVGRRLYRRPLDQREQTALLAVYQAGVTEGLDHLAAARWTLTALLQTPQFLFRTENELQGTPLEARDLNGYELAARLAAFLWVSVPDEALLALAADDSLVQSEVLQTQVTRMLADPKARRLTEVFAMDFSRARFSAYEGATDADREALNESIIATFQDHFWEQGGGISDLFTTTRFVVNPTVAELLGVDVSGAGLQAVDVSDLPHRVGLMSHPAMIAGMGDLAVGSFVNRGKYLMERLLCEHPIAFPADITTEIDEFNTMTAGLSERERAELRMERADCWSCHKQFEPLAFGFARFDGAGRYLGEIDADGKPLPLDGWVPTGETDLPAYEDVASYMQILATNEVIQTCMTEHFLDFATSRISDFAGKSEAARVGAEYQLTAGSLSDMVSAVVTSQLFRTMVTSERAQQ
jgi:hypothetical protein